MKGGARRNTVSSDLTPPQRLPLENDIDDQDNDQVQQNDQHREQDHRQKRPMNDDGDAGNEYDEEEDEDYEDEDQSGDEDVQGGDAGEAENNGDDEGPKLAEGFYEIEAVRRKRVRKGETQYLIKWRGWPEASNTWEPVVNLMSCPDVIDAFEESMRSGKQRSNRRRKRKHSVAPTLQSKKKQKQQSQQYSPAGTYDIPSVQLKIIERPLSLPSVDNINSNNGMESNVGDMTNNKKVAQSNDTGSLMVSPQLRESKETNMLDVELTEPKAPYSTNLENMSEFAIHIQEERGAKGISPVEVRPATGISEVVGTERIRVSSRVGARRRKSCAVKRFKQESNSAPTNDDDGATAITTNGDVMVGQSAINNVSPAGDGFDSNNIVDASRNVPAITNIVRPVNYSTSVVDDTENVSVSFLVRRSDGEEVVVDNSYLKEKNPILLINFYEQHLRYNSPSE